MNLAWLDRAVFREVDPAVAEPRTEIADALALGVNALWLEGRAFDDARLRALTAASRAADLKTCVSLEAGRRDAVPRVETSLACGVDAVALAGEAPEIHPLLERFRDRAFASPRVEPIAYVRPDSRAAMTTAAGGTTIERQIRATAVLTLPGLPVVDRATAAEPRDDRSTVRHHVEQLVYLRVTEADLAGSARFESVVAAEGLLVYRRGEALIVALNSGAASHRQRLVHIGDVTPVLHHHCEAHHDDGGWWLRIGPRSFGVFAAR
jgi:hypothetical protein